jgi:hypothetical protein
VIKTAVDKFRKSALTLNIFLFLPRPSSTPPTAKMDSQQKKMPPYLYLRAVPASSIETSFSGRLHSVEGEEICGLPSPLSVFLLAPAT